MSRSTPHLVTGRGLGGLSSGCTQPFCSRTISWPPELTLGQVSTFGADRPVAFRVEKLLQDLSSLADYHCWVRIGDRSAFFTLTPFSLCPPASSQSSFHVQKGKKREQYFSPFSAIFISSAFVSVIIVCLFSISTLNMYCTSTLSDIMGLIMFVKVLKTYFKFSKHLHSQTHKQEAPTQAEFSEFGSRGGVCSHLHSCDLKAQEWSRWDLLQSPFLKAGSVFNYSPTVSSLMGGTHPILIRSWDLELLVAG